MGQRASLAVITKHGAELYYSHWTAGSLDRTLFWGPAYATGFIRQHESEAEGAKILDDAWAEGGAVVDHTRRRLLWFGGDDVLWNVALRRVHLALMGRLWQDWTIEWAHEGIADIADALGISRDVVLTFKGRKPPDPRSVFERRPDDRSWKRTILSSERNGELQLWVTHPDIKEVLSAGLPLLGSLADARGVAALDYAEISEDPEEVPTGGLHVDWDRQELSFWHAHDRPGLESRVRAWFPGWHVVWWRDRFEAQAEAAGGLLLFPAPETDMLLARVRQILLDDPRTRSKERRRMLLDRAIADVFG